MMPDPSPATKPRCRRWLRRLFRWGEHLLAVAGILFIIYHVGFDLTVMTSPSMAPTLRGTCVKDGDWVLSERVAYWFRRPRRWEIVAFHSSDGVPVMKRVVGLPGEEVSLRDGRVLVNGSPVAYPPALGGIKYVPDGMLHRGRAAKCGEGYFVLGDDSGDSQDSRYDGPVALDRIERRAWLIVWPPSRIRWVTP
ncbi:MAG TPA: signal peptidase I [Planctomycetota bacterium]|nr:signal peptidase I [Planctomycetota bacterium]